MEIHLIKREIKINGDPDISFIPSFPIDYKRADSLPSGKAIAFESKKRRDQTANSKLWALCHYFVNNLPERYFYQDETGDSIPMIKSARQLYEMLKIRVGFVKVIELDGDIYKIPLESKFDSLDDEMEYLEKFHNPAIHELCIMSDMTEYDLIGASKFWRSEI